MGQVESTQTGGAKSTYVTHDNGGRPFRVTINGKHVSIEKDISKDYDRNEYAPLLKMTVSETFVGKKSPGGGYDGLSPKEAEGNSLLFRLGANRYRFVGHEIYDFSPVDGDEIVAFYSDVGNSDVPYPYAVGLTHMYFMLEGEKAVEMSYFDLNKPIYDQYYYEHFAGMCLKGAGHKDYCKNKEAARARIAEFNAKSRSIKRKMVQRRLV